MAPRWRVDRGYFLALLLPAEVGRPDSAPHRPRRQPSAKTTHRIAWLRSHRIAADPAEPEGVATGPVGPVAVFVGREREVDHLERAVPRDAAQFAMLRKLQS